ncbi:MAG: TrmH family RNA methyltransferase [Propionibacteriaceae bacterium]
MSAPSARAHDRAALTSLSTIAAGHPAARRYALARRNQLPRSNQVTAVSGWWAHELVLSAGCDVQTLLWCPGPDEPTGLIASLRSVAGSTFLVSERTLARLHPGLSAPAVVSVVQLPSWQPAQVLTEQAQLMLVADGIEYAGNLGSLVRTADACGADGLILTRPRVRPSHSKVFLASRGTVLTMPILTYSSAAGAKRDLAAAGFTSYVAMPEAATSYRDIDFAAARVAVVVGSEGDGVSDGWRTPGLRTVQIPMHGNADSLNVAVSAAIVLFEARAQLGRRPTAAGQP